MKRLGIAIAVLSISMSVHGGTKYVSPAGDHVPPYDTWRNAATDVFAAVAATVDGDTVLVTNGYYAITNRIKIVRDVTLESVNGAAHTTLDGGYPARTNRCLWLTHTNAVVEGFTITGGRSSRGPGVYLEDGGTVSDCVIVSNSASWNGGGVYAENAGVVERCRIEGNQTDNAGGGAYLESGGLLSHCDFEGNVSGQGGGAVATFFGGTVRNCRLFDNEGKLGGALNVYKGGLIENCTIAGNHARQAGGPGAIVAQAGGVTGRVVSTILYANTPAEFAGPLLWSRSCLPLTVPGGGNITNDPQFLDLPSGDLRIESTSPCLDQGSGGSWMVTGTDLVGAPRVLNGTVDMGAYEFNRSALRCDFQVSQSVGQVPLEVEFQAEVEGKDTDILLYEWDFDGDGVFDRSGSDLDHVGHAYVTWGAHTVVLRVTNSHQEKAVRTRSACVTTYTGTVYVSPRGRHTFPFHTWETAATNIQAAVDSAAFDDVTVIVTNGTYDLNAPIEIDKGITLQSVNGAEATIVDGGYPARTNRCLTITHAETVVEGFTLTHGRSNYGGGVYLDGGGTIRDCILTSNSVSHTGGGVHLEGGGTVEDSAFRGNTANAGGGAYCSYGGMVDTCNFETNGASAEGGGVSLFFGGVLRGSRLIGNSANAGGGVSYYKGGQVQSCTIVGNQAFNEPSGGIFSRTGTVTGQVFNTIVYFNEPADADGALYWDYSCTPVQHTGAGNTTNDPRFVDMPLGNLRLWHTSPCIEGGREDDWMAAATDLDGEQRLIGARPDMGAYEFNPDRLWCDFSVDPLEGDLPLEVHCQAVVGGAETHIELYEWDFDGDGVFEQSGSALDNPSHTYTTWGAHTIKLRVSNAIRETATREHRSCVVTRPETIYVSRAGSHTYPYDTWAKAARSINSAVDSVLADGITVIVAEDEYVLRNPIAIDFGVTLTSNGRTDHTIINGGYPAETNRCLLLTHSNAVVEGFTITGGCAEDGGGVYISGGGLVRDCVVVTNVAEDHGGGVYIESDGAVDSCQFFGNGAEFGGGIYLYRGGMVSLCDLESNTAAVQGGGLTAFFGGALRGCRVFGNQAPHGGGMYLYKGGFVENCTIAGNHSCGITAVIGQGTGVVHNTIIHDNTPYNTAGDMLWDYSCCPDATGGVGNITSDPMLFDVPSGDLHISPNSPCVDTAHHASWMASATDLDGKDRIIGTRPDMGAYEVDPDELWCDFTISPTGGQLPLEVRCQAEVGGANAVIVLYEWDFDNDGVFEQSGETLDRPVHTYNEWGWHTIVLRVRNDRGETSTRLHEDCVNTYPDVVYVSPGGSSTWPYDTWHHAANDIQTAIDSIENDGVAVLVTDAVYTVSERISVQRGITIESVNGAGVTILDAGYPARTNGCVMLAHSNAVMRGFTLTGGRASQGGGAYLLYGAVLSDCAVVTNSVSHEGGGVYVRNSGVVSNCWIAGNQGDIGAGVYLYHGGFIDNCHVITNSSHNYGGGIYFDMGGTVRGCRIWSNVGKRGGGINVNEGGQIKNCSIAANHSWEGLAGGINAQAVAATGTVFNTIVYFNTPYEALGPLHWSYSCTPTPRDGSGNITSDPLFYDVPSGDLGLSHLSPCIDHAHHESWMFGSCDLAGEQRIIGAFPDMGAYESNPDTLWCNFTMTPTSGRLPLEVVCQAEVGGESAEIVLYEWDFDDDGVFEQSGASLDRPVHVYNTWGHHTIILRVRNDKGETSTRRHQNCVNTYPNVVYVSPGGSCTWPYDTWHHAANDIQTAVDSIENDDVTVVVTDAVYTVKERIDVQRAVTIESVNGAAVTVLDGGYPARTNGCVMLAHSNAVMRGFTLTGGRAGRGGGAYLEYGAMLSDCAVVTNSALHDGGGVYVNSSGGVSKCWIEGNQADTGGGVYLYYGGTVDNCHVITNSAHQGGGGVTVLMDGTIRGCRIWGNVGKRGGGIDVYKGGSIENCSIAANHSYEGHAGGINAQAGTITGMVFNTIVYFNTPYETIGPLKWSYSCTPTPVDGPGNITSDPLFYDVPSGDLGLSQASPCINLGHPAWWMDDATDLAGEARIVNTYPDMGAYEFNPDRFWCDFTVTPREGHLRLRVQAEAAVGGTIKDIALYEWDFDGDGVYEQSGPGLRITEHLYSHGGRHSIGLRVSDGGGLMTTRYHKDYVLAHAMRIYVAPGGSHTPPFDSWETAATNIQSAIASVPFENTSLSIMVTDTIFEVTSPIVVDKPVTLVTLRGAMHTTLHGGYPHRTNRCMTITHSNAVVEGFTFTHGRASQGAGVYLDGGGTLRDCIFTHNSAGNHGGGAYLNEGGRVERSFFEANDANTGGGAFCYQGGLIDACHFVTNAASAEGGGVHMFFGGKLRASRLQNNVADAGAGASFYAGGTIEHCTLIDNVATDELGGGLFARGGSGSVTGDVVNTILYYNTPRDAQGAVHWDHCCLGLGVAGDGCITNLPLFADRQNGDIRLVYGSPCIDAGMDPGGSPAYDINGRSRPLDGNSSGTSEFDIGAYECAPIEDDTDGDGMANGRENIAGTDPDNPSSVLRVLGVRRTGAGGLAMEWESAAGRLYSIRTCENLVDGVWTDTVDFVDVPGGNAMSYTSSAAGPRFYRIGVRRE